MNLGMSSPATLDRRRTLALVVAAGVIAIAGGAAAGADRAEAGEITVFAAASLQNALDEVAHAWEASGAGRGRGWVRLSYAASSVIARQIEQGAPADIFVSADGDWMDVAERKGLILGASRRNLLSNHLALIAPAGSSLRLRMSPHAPLLQALHGGRLAIAGADVPAGRYARASLQALDLWRLVQDHLASGESVRASLAFVARGEAPLGIVYDTDARIEPKVRIVDLIPDRLHPPIVYPAALLKGASPGAAAFLAFLQGPRAGAIFRRYGFTTHPR